MALLSAFLSIRVAIPVALVEIVVGAHLSKESAAALSECGDS